MDRALTEDRSLLITTLNRGTLHLVRTEDYAWLHALTTPRLFTNSARRLDEEGVPPDDAERGVAAVVRALAEEGPLNRAQLRDRIAAVGVQTDGQALVHVLALTALRGLTVRGPMAGADQAHVLVSDWLGPQPEVDRGAALAELARRYLAGHGPAADSDLARWAGLPLRDARYGLRAIASELREREDGLLDVRDRPPAEDLPPPRLLGAFDPVLHGWTDRAPILGPHTHVVTRNGMFRPFALVGGRAAATWTMPKGKVALAPFARLTEPVGSALAAEAADVERFLTSAGTTPRGPTSPA